MLRQFQCTGCNQTKTPIETIFFLPLLQSPLKIIIFNVAHPDTEPNTAIICIENTRFFPLKKYNFFSLLFKFLFCCSQFLLDNLKAQRTCIATTNERQEFDSLIGTVFAMVSI